MELRAKGKVVRARSTELTEKWKMESRKLKSKAEATRDQKSAVRCQ
jgi:hypothetical protein